MEYIAARVFSQAVSLHSQISKNMSRPNRSRTNTFFRAFRHIVMGLILIAFGIIVAIYQRFGTIELSSITSYSLAGIMMVYGLFRIWRGTKEFRGDETDDFIT